VQPSFETATYDSLLKLKCFSRRKSLTLMVRTRQSRASRTMRPMVIKPYAIALASLRDPSFRNSGDYAPFAFLPLFGRHQRSPSRLNIHRYGHESYFMTPRSVAAEFALGMRSYG
jgi:hypothetical protein